MKNKQGIPQLHTHTHTYEFNCWYALCLAITCEQGAYVVMACDAERDIGVDVMDHRQPGSGSVARFFQLMQDTFTPAEWHLIKQHHDEQRQLVSETGMTTRGRVCE